MSAMTESRTESRRNRRVAEMKDRSVLYVGLAGLVVSAACWGQQLQTSDEQRTQPPAVWQRVNERKVSLLAGTMWPYGSPIRSRVIRARRVTASRAHSTRPSW